MVFKRILRKVIWQELRIYEKNALPKAKNYIVVILKKTEKINEPQKQGKLNTY